jgi:hypothetical protein
MNLDDIGTRSDVKTRAPTKRARLQYSEINATR